MTQPYTAYLKNDNAILELDQHMSLVKRHNDRRHIRSRPLVRPLWAPWEAGMKKFPPLTKDYCEHIPCSSMLRGSVATIYW